MSSCFRTARSQIPAPLVGGAVRALHIVFLYVVIFVTTGIVAFKMSRSVDPDLRFALQSLLGQGVSAFLILVLTLVVPELRRSIPILYSRGRAPISALDAVLLVAVMLAWGYGAHRLLVLYPLLLWRPDLFSLVGYFEHFPSVGPVFLLLWALASGVVAPFAEELLFRGYLQNLWQHRWGVGWGVFLSSFVFGLAHLQYWVFAMVSGIFLSMVYLKYHSLWPGTLLHGLYNLVSAPYLLGPLFFEKSKLEIASLSGWIPELVLTAAFFPLLVLFWRRFRPAT